MSTPAVLLALWGITLVVWAVSAWSTKFAHKHQLRQSDRQFERAVHALESADRALEGAEQVVAECRGKMREHQLDADEWTVEASAVGRARLDLREVLRGTRLRGPDGGDRQLR